MNNPRKLLDIYIKFREKIKSSMKTNMPDYISCIIVTKEDMIKWKKFFNYSKQLISNISLLNEWEYKIKEKNVKKPTFKILKDYKEIKTHLSKNKGISFLNKEFFNYYLDKNERLEQVNCYVGGEKIIMSIDGGRMFNQCLICKTGSKSSLKYIIYETVENMENNKRELISNIISKKSFNNKPIFPYNHIHKTYIYEYKKCYNAEIHYQNNINIDDDFNLRDNNVCNISNNFIQDTEECNIPNCIFEFFILLFRFNENIRNKISNRIDKPEKYYLINFVFLNNIKTVYNYDGMCKELQKYKYFRDKSFENKFKDIVSSIKQKEIIKEKVPLDDINIIPDTFEMYGTRHNYNFNIINEEIYQVIKQIQNDYNLTKTRKLQIYEFYFKPQIFYKGKNFIKIGIFNKDYIFEMHYYISFDLMSANLTMIISDIIKSKSIDKFFENKNIHIKEKDVHDLIEYGRKIGKVINFIFQPQCSINKIETKIPSYDKLRGNNVKIKKIVIKNNNNNNAAVDNSSINDIKNLDYFPIKNIEQINITPMIGLTNIGQTCYMNAALQCFSNTKALLSYFLNYNNLQYLKNNAVIISDESEPSLVIEFLKLIRHLWCDSPKSSFAPNEFKKAIGQIEPLFKNFEANDAKDFVNFMVMRLHDELNGVDNHLTKQNNLILPSVNINPYDYSQVLQSYLYEFQLNFNSFISNCFYGTTQGEFECQNCKMQIYQTCQNLPLVKYNYQTFFFLNFPLDEVRKYILSNQMLYMKYMNTNTNPNVEVNLIDCFYYYQKDDILSCYCDRCQNINAQVLTRTKLYVAPIYLILLFNRGKGIQFKIKLTFPEQFDTNGIFINSSGIYQLYGVVKHYGDSSASGHFTAYCRSPIDGCWYHYNDAMVTPVNEQEKYIIQDNGMTYMLFYQIKK